MHHLKFLAVLAMFGITFGQIGLQARVYHVWSYEELMKGADLVAVIEPTKTELNPDKQNMGDIDPQHMQGLTTQFKLHGVFKGQAPSDGQLILKYFTYKRDGMADDGALFIHFKIGQIKYEITDVTNDKMAGSKFSCSFTPIWLAFLKKEPDGTYSPVTGQYDASLSFKELHDPSFFSSE